MQHPLTVAHDLHLDMTGTVEEPLEIKLAVAKRRRGLGLRGMKVMVKLGLVRGNPDAARAAALSPMVRMVSALGPTNTRPAAATASANRAFSDKNP
jgi:hypothetical protein